MWTGTNYDYDSESVTNVYGPFQTRNEAVQAVRRLAASEVEVLRKAWDDVEELDTLNEEDGALEITFDDENDNGCLYQVVEMERPE